MIFLHLLHFSVAATYTLNQIWRPLWLKLIFLIKSDRYEYWFFYLHSDGGGLRDLCKLPNGRDESSEKLDLALVSKAVLSNCLIMNGVVCPSC